MMSREELNIALAAVLTTALDTEPSPFSETMAYLALGAANWETTKRVLTMGELATFDNNSIALTDKGRMIARECARHIPRKEAAIPDEPAGYRRHSGPVGGDTTKRGAA